MNPKEVRALDIILSRPASVETIAAKLGLSKRQSYRIVKSLVSKGLIERSNDRLIISSNEFGVALRRVASKYGLSELLGGSAPVVLASLLEPKKMNDLLRSTRLSEDGLQRILSKLQSTGVVVRAGWTYGLIEDESLQLFVRLIRERRSASEIEPVAIPLYSNGFIVKKVPRGSQARGTLTAFSRFEEYGVHYVSPFDYYVYPPTGVTPTMVLVHALLGSETNQQRSMCGVFYLANRSRIDILEARRIAKGTPALPVLLDLENYVAGLEVHNSELFLPSDEFGELCDLYRVQFRPPPTVSDLVASIGRWAKLLRHPVTAYLLGGANMVLRGLKPSTVDIDAIVDSEEDYRAVEEAILNAGYSRAAESEWTQGDVRASPSNIFTHRSFMRIDLFTHSVTRKVALTDTVKSRATTGISIGNLNLRLLDLHDVVLLKLATTRERDVGDIASIARKHKLDWRLILHEFLQLPTGVIKELSFLFLDTLDVLEAVYGVKVPRYVRSKIQKIALDSAIEKALAMGITDPKEIAKTVELPTSLVRKRLRELETSRGESGASSSS